MKSEIITNEFYDEKCDVFSFSIIMFELLVETTLPYGFVSQIEYRVATNPLFRPTIPLDFQVQSEQIWFIELMSTCWKHSAKDRPPFHEIITLIDQHLQYLTELR